MIISLCGIISNGFLLLVFAVDPLRCLRSVSSGLILNLCFADFLTAIMIFFWATMHWTWAPDLVADIIFCLVWFGYSASFLTIALLSLERYIVIRHIWSADTIVTKRRTVYAVVVIWLTSAISFIQLDEKNSHIHMFVLSSVFELCVVVVIILYVRLWVIRRRHAPHQHRALVKDECKLTTVVFVLILLLIVTTVPLIFLYQLLNGLFLFCGSNCAGNEIKQISSYLTPVLAVNFAVNPVIYGWRLPKYRRSFAALCSTILTRKPTTQKLDKIVGTHKRNKTQLLEVNSTQITNGSSTSL